MNDAGPMSTYRLHTAVQAMGDKAYTPEGRAEIDRMETEWKKFLASTTGAALDETYSDLAFSHARNALDGDYYAIEDIYARLVAFYLQVLELQKSWNDAILSSVSA